MSKSQLLNYPIALLQRLYSGKNERDKFDAFYRLKGNKRFLSRL